MTRRVAQLIAALVAIALVALGVHVVTAGARQKTLTAYFPVAVHIYAGSDVDVLGVKVGSVQSVTPEGTQVKVVLSYDAARRIPADASAVVVDPTLVADRVVQLTPVYSGGNVLADEATIPLSSNEVPVELDQLNRSLYQLTQALGPTGANRHGALARAIAVGDANLKGQGGAANRTIRRVSDLAGTLSDNRDNLVATVNNLQAFTTTLADSDHQTRGFATELSRVSAELDGERASFGAALRNLGGALGQVATFIRHNRSALSADVQGLSTVSTILARERTLLGHIADIGAVGISNYPHMYTPSARTYNARFDFNSTTDNPALYVCQLLGSVGGSAKSCLKYLTALKGLGSPLDRKGNR
jgi:phospholipid/cholesterol/gamma-HCH transport system substrate-binding protein